MEGNWLRARPIAYRRDCGECRDYDSLIFALNPELDADAISHILENRTLRWTMKRSSPAYWFLNEIVHHVPALKLRCPEIWVYNDYDLAILDAVAVHAFLNGQIAERTLWTVHNINGSEDPGAWLELSRSEFKRVRAGLNCGAVEKPIFPWQSDVCLHDG